MSLRRFKYGLIFALLAGVCVYWAWRLQWPWCVLLGNLAVCWAGVAIAFLSGQPGLLGKRSNGRIHFIALIVYWPYMLLSIVILRLAAQISSEPAVSRITPLLYLGRRLSSSEARQLLPKDLAGTIDLTAEFAEPRGIRDHPYLCIPTLDTLNPHLDQLLDALAFIDAQIIQGPIFVHCAMGHGRSATIVAAYIMQTQGLSPDEAIQALQFKRSGVGLHKEQIELLVRFEREHNQKCSETGNDQ